MKYLDLIDNNHDKIIVTDQIEMEFKKNRLEIIQESLSKLKPPDISSSVPPVIVSEAEPVRVIKKLKQRAEKEHRKLRDRIY